MNNKESKLLAADLFQQPAQIRILRFLWKSRAEWSGREVARKVDLSPTTCHDAMKKLHARGLVLFRRVSNVHLYQVNPENYLVQKLFAPLFKAEESVPGEVLKLVKHSLLASAPKSSILSIVLFGSMARGEESLESDLDLLVVVSEGHDARAVEDALDRLRKELASRFSVPLAPYVQTLSELRRKHERKMPLIGRILKEGRLVYGKDPKEMIA